jgi:diaminopimelate epimerase
MDGGTLHVDWRESDDHLLLGGPSTIVYTGEIDLL